MIVLFAMRSEFISNCAAYTDLNALLSQQFVRDKLGRITQNHLGRLAAMDPATKTYLLGSPDVSEIPPGNSTNISANIVDIDPLTGRAVLQFFKIQ